MHQLAPWLILTAMHGESEMLLLWKTSCEQRGKEEEALVVWPAETNTSCSVDEDHDVTAASYICNAGKRSTAIGAETVEG